MEWWQTALILLATIPAGVIVGTLFSYIILRFVQKGEVTFLGALTLLFVKTPQAPSVAKEQATFTVPELLAELKHNRKIAAEPLGDSLLPFPTHVWDRHQYEVNKLPANLRDDLEQVYDDIRLANSLVWLSTEFGRRTPNVNENYLKLCSSIAERLDKIKQNIASH